MTGSPKIAYVLSGGGSLGSFQVGVLRQLHDKGMRPDAIFGTSAGALNAAGYGYRGIDRLERVWDSIEGQSDIIIFRWWNLFLGQGAYDTKPLERLINSAIHDGEPSCEVVVTAVNLSDGKLKYFSSNEKLGNFKEMVLASASIPVVMEPVGSWVDGGVREQTPLKKPIKEGFDKIVVILALPLSDPFEGSDWKPTFPGILSVGLRSIQIMSHEVFVNDMRRTLNYNKREDKRKIELEIYAPSFVPMDALDFDPDGINEFMNHGRKVSPHQGVF